MHYERQAVNITKFSGAPERLRMSLIGSGGATPGRARANALAKKPLPWSLPWQNFCPAQNLFGAYIAPALVTCMTALVMPWLQRMSGAATAHRSLSLDNNWAISWNSINRLKESTDEVNFWQLIISTLQVKMELWLLHILPFILDRTAGKLSSNIKCTMEPVNNIYKWDRYSH